MPFEDLSNFFLSNAWLLALIVLWTIPWKGVALWKAARNSDKIWFIALFLLNTLAILEIIYIFFAGKNKENKENKKSGSDH